MIQYKGEFVVTTSKQKWVSLMKGEDKIILKKES